MRRTGSKQDNCKGLKGQVKRVDLIHQRQAAFESTQAGTFKCHMEDYYEAPILWSGLGKVCVGKSERLEVQGSWLLHL